MMADANASADSAELEDLFDSIAHAHTPAAAPAVAAARIAADHVATVAEGDNPELEDLFDSIARSKRERIENAAPSTDALENTSGGTNRAGAHACKVINSVGHLTRQLHDTLAELGYDRQLQECAAAALPDARQRLAYVVTLTEQAASRSLNAVEAATPLQESLAADATSLAADWDRILRGQGDVKQFRNLARATREYLGSVSERTSITRDQLREIIMAQEFQDLTGQVLKRITDLVHTLETQLLRLLVENAPAPIRNSEALGLLNGPAINPGAMSDVVANQAQVDELLESLGF